MAADFHPPEGVRFSCSQCGDCCRTWNVWLGPGERESLAGRDWTGIAPDLVGLETTRRIASGPMKGRLRLERREDARCVYLGDRNQCRLHEHFGESAKPLICRLYPFGFYPVGNRVGVDVSFACRAVSQESGDLVEGRTGEWAKMLADAGGDGTDRRKHALDAGRAIDGELLWELEHALITLLKDRSMAMPRRIHACLRFLELGLTGDPAKPTARILRDAILRSVPAQTLKSPHTEASDPSQRAFFDQLLYLMLNPLPHDHDEMSAVEQALVTERRLEQARRYRERAGVPHVRDVELSATFDRIAAIDASWFLGPEAGIVETFLCAKITGQKFLVAGDKELPFIEASHRLLLLYPMIVWTAKALAADRNVSAVSAPDVRSSIRLLDASMGSVVFERLSKASAEAFSFLLRESRVTLAITRELLNLKEI